jgi:hypothetical protein
MVATPGLENPERASEGVNMPPISNKLNTPNKMLSAGKRLLASRNKEHGSIKATAKRSICIKSKIRVMRHY